MKYLIDSANFNEINDALDLGAVGVTANPSMYLKEKVNFYEFLHKANALGSDFLSAEVLGSSLEEMLSEVQKILDINKNIIIKVNFSKTSLKLVKKLSKLGVKTAVTLIFNVNQATLAINAGADYIFPFIGRNDEIGDDGLEILSNICEYISMNNYNTKVVAASLKNLHHLKCAALLGVDYVAVPYALMEKSIYHTLTVSGDKTFQDDWSKVSKN